MKETKCFSINGLVAPIFIARKNIHCNLFFNVHVKKIKIEIHPKMIMIWTYENMAHFKPFISL